MANNLESNVSKIVARKFLEHFESSRVISKTVDTQLIAGMHGPSTGDTVYLKRPHQFKAINTADGDLTGLGNNIISGQAPATTQDLASVKVEWNSVEEALELDQLDEILRPAAEELVIDVEKRLIDYIIANSNLSYGDSANAVSKWGDVAGAGALMDALGVPMSGDRYYVMNPFTSVALADTQSGLASGNNKLVDTAWEKAQLSANFGGLKALTSNALRSYTSGDSADRVGALSANPDVTYVTHKDTMRQTLAVSGFTANATIKAGEIIEIAGRNRVNSRNGEIVLNGATAELFRAVVAQDVTLDGSGAGNIVISGPAIYEATGSYNTVDSAPVSGDVITLKSAASTVIQPNLFYHKQAFALAAVELKKLHATDTIMNTLDGMSVRMTKYSNGDAGTNKVRFDLLPAFGRLNPFFAGQGFGK